MSNLKALLKTCATRTQSKHTYRKLITFRSTKAYKKCLNELKELGIKPFKTVARGQIIGCHFHKSVLWQSIASHPHVKLIEKDFKIRAHGVLRSKPVTLKGRSIPMLTPATVPALVTWNIRRVKAPESWAATRGKSIKVAIIDSGIANHPDLRIAGGINTINGGSYADDNGHGTHVAGIVSASDLSGKVIGTAPEVSLYAVKALDQNGDGYVSDIIDGINWCITNKMHVINMSFGILDSNNSGTLHDAIKRAAKHGIVMVASAGNSGKSSNQIDVPASFRETIAVAATTKTNKIASFSSRGKGIGLAAPGEKIVSTWLNGMYKKMSGTSMSSPHVAGGAALLLAGEPGISVREIKKRLRKRALKLRKLNARTQGAGLMQLNRIFKSK